MYVKMANYSDKTTAPTKRAASDTEPGESASPEPKRIKSAPGIIDKSRNPISILNELRSGLKYNLLEQTGPSHAPLFKVSVEVDGQVYYGCGKSKKAARSKAAEEALKCFIQLPHNTHVLCLSTVEQTNLDFTSDAIEVIQKETIARKKQTSKGAVMLLNELYPNVRYECTENAGCAVNRFKITITLANQTFIGTGSSKKLAKHAAATSALAKLSVNIDDLKLDCNRPIVLAADQERADYVGRLIQEKFESLMANDPTHLKRKVMAGIVMTRGSKLSDAEIISVTTGTKCVSGEYMNMNGGSLNDMHAEIVSRRCLMSYFYDQLEKIAGSENPENLIFVPREDGKGFRLKEGLEFHLYINTAPCGDARIFNPHEESDDLDRHPNRSSRGQLRTKIESGEGTIPVKVNASLIQTWDGVLQGERLLTMSCSDKICRWNIVGLQGALLSHFIEPIYLKSLVLGSLMRETHLNRAIYGRIEDKIQGLPPPFRLNRPSVYLTTSRETRHPGKAPNFAVIWAQGLSRPEIVSINVGKPEFGVSRFCKRELMSRFYGLLGKIPSITEIEKNPPSLYCELKAAVQPYKVAKESLYDAFVKAGLGNWISKPMEQDMFEFTELNQ